jgi:hypothetical protein
MFPLRVTRCILNRFFDLLDNLLRPSRFSFMFQIRSVRQCIWSPITIFARNFDITNNYNNNNSYLVMGQSDEMARRNSVPKN